MKAQSRRQRISLGQLQRVRGCGLDLGTLAGACAVLALAGGCDAGAMTADNTDDGNGASGSGASGAPGASGSAGIVMNPPDHYPQNTPGARFPYPQGHALPFCAFPTYSTDTVATAYAKWKNTFFQAGRVIRPENANDTVSEGIAYGMLIGVYMNDRALFDTLWAFAQSKLDASGLMNWHIDASGNVVNQGGATDADEDMAFALLMAGAQWGGSYTALGTNMANAIFDHEVDVAGGNVLKPGDNFGGASLTNPSYFAPSYYRVFAKVSPRNWGALLDKSYAVLAASAGSLGLVPNWVNAQGVAMNGPGGDANGVYFGYDACRTPWRIALDYCANGEPRAKAYLDLIVGFFSNVSPIRDGYTTTGMNPPGTLGDYNAGMAFYGPAGVGAMAGGHDVLLTRSYALLSAQGTAQASPTGVFTYFHGSWGMLSLLTMSGNFWDMTAP